MTKEQKLYEALAILAQSQGPLFLKFYGLLNQKQQKHLKPFAVAIDKAFGDMENELLMMLEQVKASRK